MKEVIGLLQLEFKTREVIGLVLEIKIKGSEAILPRQFHLSPIGGIPDWPPVIVTGCLRDSEYLFLGDLETWRQTSKDKTKSTIRSIRHFDSMSTHFIESQYLGLGGGWVR